MTLLCGKCHDLVTRGFISKEKVQEAMHQLECREARFAVGAFDMGSRFPVIQLGDSTFDSDGDLVLFEMDGVDLLKISSPEQPGGPFRPSVSFYDMDEAPVLTIPENERRANTTTWDIEVQGQTITIRRERGQVDLPPKN